MQVSCGNCQLSFDAPEGASGLVCPICRGPLLPKSGRRRRPRATKAAAGLERRRSRRPDRHPERARRSRRASRCSAPSGDAAIGEVHLLAGGVSDALFAGKSTDDSLDKLRAAKPTRFRVEQRLPNPTDGDLTYPGPESGTLESRAARPPDALLRGLRHHLRDRGVARQRKRARRIQARRDRQRDRGRHRRARAPRRGDASGRRATTASTSSRSSCRPWRPSGRRPPPRRPRRSRRPRRRRRPPAQQSATKTIFGMPAAEIIKARAAAEAAKAAAAAGPHRAARRPAPPSASPRRRRRRPPPRPPPRRRARQARRPGRRPSQVPAPVARASASSATKTIFGVPTPGCARRLHAGDAAEPDAGPGPVAAAPAAAASAPAADDCGKTGARKVAVPAPEVVDRAGRRRRSGRHAPGLRLRAPAAEAPKRPSTPVPVAKPAPGTRRPLRPRATERVRAPKKRETPIWTYVGVGVTFGLALIGIYQLVGMLAH